MTDRDDKDIACAERALLLPGEDAAEHPADRWALRLAGLCHVVPPVSAPSQLLAVAEARIALEDQAIALANTRRALRRWQGAAVAGGLLAASLAAVVVMPAIDPSGPAGHVAVVTADADPGRAGMVVTLGPGPGWATVVPLVEPAANGAFEMWHLPEGAETPRSIGLLPAERPSVVAVSADQGDTFAISLEAAGGSPTGLPTRPLFHGSMTAIREGQGAPTD